MNSKEAETQVSKVLGVKIKDGRFKYGGYELYFYVSDYDKSKPIEYRLGSPSFRFVQHEDQNLDFLLQEFLSKWPKTLVKIKAKEAKDNQAFNADQEIHRIMTNAKYKNDMRHDGQNIQIRTGKNPELVKVIIDALDEWQSRN